MLILVADAVDGLWDVFVEPPALAVEPNGVVGRVVAANLPIKNKRTKKTKENKKGVMEIGKADGRLSHTRGFKTWVLG